MTWKTLTSGIFPSIQIVALDLFGSHPISLLYLRSIPFFQQWQQSYKTVRVSHCAVHFAMAAKKIKLDEPAISQILDSETDSESGAEASDLEDEFSESEEEQEASAREDEPRSAISGGGSPTYGTPQGRNIKFHPFFGPAIGLKNSETPYINEDSSPLAVLMLFFKDIFLLLVEQTNLY